MQATTRTNRNYKVKNNDFQMDQTTQFNLYMKGTLI